MSQVENSTQERFAERARDHQSATRRSGMRRALVVVTLLALLWLVLGSSLFSVRTVEVTGMGGAPGTIAREFGEDQRGQPLARLNTAALAKRITDKALPVRIAEISRGWPSTLTITLIPRTPVVALLRGSDQVELVDADGVVYNTVQTAPSNVPNLTSDTNLTKDHITAVVEAMSGISAKERAQVEEIAINSGGELRFNLRSVQINWGQQGDAGRKAKLVRLLLGTKPKPKAIDVSAPDTPVTR